jgi:hypothetical protein
VYCNDFYRTPIKSTTSLFAGSEFLNLLRQTDSDMRSPAQIEASRANGRRSHDPITEQGKKKSSQNAIRHGLLAASIVCQSENRSSFLAMLNALMNEHQPATETQHMLVETMAVTRWRLIRNWEMQRQAFEWDAENHGGRNPQERVIRGIRETGPLHCHQLLLRYEVALERQFNKALRELQHLQRAGRCGIQSSVEDAAAASVARCTNEESPKNTPPAERTQEHTENKDTPTAKPAEVPTVRYATAQASGVSRPIFTAHPDSKAQSPAPAPNNHRRIVT